MLVGVPVHWRKEPKSRINGSIRGSGFDQSNFKKRPGAINLTFWLEAAWLIRQEHGGLPPSDGSCAHFGKALLHQDHFAKRSRQSILCTVSNLDWTRSLVQESWRSRTGSWSELITNSSSIQQANAKVHPCSQERLREWHRKQAGWRLKSEEERCRGTNCCRIRAKIVS